MFACPMKVESALALTPAAIIRDAKVCRHSWSVMRLRPADFHASSARSVSFSPLKGRVAVAPKNRSDPARPVAARWLLKKPRRMALTGTLHLQPEPQAPTAEEEREEVESGAEYGY